MLSNIKFDLALIFVFCASLVGGFIAYRIGLPMPFLIGGVIGSAIFVITYENTGRKLGNLHPYFRTCAIAAIGVMIGSNVSPDILSHLPFFWVSALAIIPFVIVGHAGNYAILRVVGKYSVPDAYFAGMTGGLVEATVLGENAGADVRVLTIQHFIRVLSMMMAVPLIFFIITGEVVGSAAANDDGAQATRFEVNNLGLIFLLAAAGVYLGKLIRLPVSALLGPLLLTVTLSLTGVTTIEAPSWLLNTAQFVIGATLGAKFSGINRTMLKRGFGLGMLSVSYLLLLAFAFAYFLEPFVPAGVPALFISFAAGGLTEMTLIALSLDLSPVIVALHHLVRIFATISVAGQIFGRYIAKDKPD